MSVDTLPNCAQQEHPAPIEPVTSERTAASQVDAVLHHATARDAQRDPLAVFLTDAHAVATAIDPMLASLLSNMLGRTPPEAQPPYMGDRRDGLELCQRLLTYVRQEVADKRLDVSLGYIAVELRSLHGLAAGSSFAH